MLDIARRAGVSVASVSRVVNNDSAVHPTLRLKIEKVTRALGYRPSANLRHAVNPQKTIYFLLANRELQIPFHSGILQAVEEDCHERGDIVIFRSLHYGVGDQASHLATAVQSQTRWKKESRADGAILTGLTYPNLLEALKLARIPAVVLGNNYSGPELKSDAVYFDGRQGAIDATRYLIDLGHRHILFIGDPSLSWFSALHDGYLEAMQSAGLSPITQTKGLTDSFYSNGYGSVQIALDASPEITAIFAAYDGTAMGAWKALNDRGLSVPSDVSLIGFDDEDYSAYTAPPLTTVRIDVAEIGKALIAQLRKRWMQPRGQAPTVRLGSVLIKRSTCWPPKARR
jgi:LacI family transcriptional regulator